MFRKKNQKLYKNQKQRFYRRMSNYLKKIRLAEKSKNCKYMTEIKLLPTIKTGSKIR